MVTVVRSGGFAGIRRQWEVTALGTDAAQWIALVGDCPWDDADRNPDPPADTAPARPAPDRFAWSVHACLPEAEHRADLTEDEARGPWRALIDAVRDASASHR